MNTQDSVGEKPRSSFDSLASLTIPPPPTSKPPLPPKGTLRPPTAHGQQSPSSSNPSFPRLPVLPPLSPLDPLLPPSPHAVAASLAPPSSSLGREPSPSSPPQQLPRGLGLVPDVSSASPLSSPSASPITPSAATTPITTPTPNAMHTHTHTYFLSTHTEQHYSPREAVVSSPGPGEGSPLPILILDSHSHSHNSHSHPDSHPGLTPTLSGSGSTSSSGATGSIGVGRGGGVPGLHAREQNPSTAAPLPLPSSSTHDQHSLSTRQQIREYESPQRHQRSMTEEDHGQELVVPATLNSEWILSPAPAVVENDHSEWIVSPREAEFGVEESKAEVKKTTAVDPLSLSKPRLPTLLAPATGSPHPLSRSQSFSPLASPSPSREAPHPNSASRSRSQSVSNTPSSSEPSSRSSIVSVEFECTCGAAGVDAGEGKSREGGSREKQKEGCTCSASYATRLQQWVREQCHFVGEDEDEIEEDEGAGANATSGSPTTKNPAKDLSSKLNEGQGRGKGAKWYWHASTSSSTRQSWEGGGEFEGEGGLVVVRGDSPVLGVEDDVHVVEGAKGGDVRSDSPILGGENELGEKGEKRFSVRTVSASGVYGHLEFEEQRERVYQETEQRGFEQGNRGSEQPGYRETQRQAQVYQGTEPLEPLEDRWEQEQVMSPTSTHASYRSAGSGSGSNASSASTAYGGGTVLGHGSGSSVGSGHGHGHGYSGSSIGHGYDQQRGLGYGYPQPGDQVYARGRSASASAVSTLQGGGERRGHGYSQSVSVAVVAHANASGNGRVYDEMQARYQSALGPAFDLDVNGRRDSNVVQEHKQEDDGEVYVPTAPASPYVASVSSLRGVVAPPSTPAGNGLVMPRTPSGKGWTPPNLSPQGSMSGVVQTRTPPMSPHGSTVIQPTLSSPPPPPMSPHHARTPPTMSPNYVRTPPTMSPNYVRTPPPMSPHHARTPPTLSSHASVASLRHAVYIIDSEQVRERLDELIRRESVYGGEGDEGPSGGQQQQQMQSAGQQQTQTQSAPPSAARFGRLRSQSLVSVAESEDEEQEDYGVWNGGALGLGLSAGGREEDEDEDEDRRATVYASEGQGGVEDAVRKMGLDRIDPVASAVKLAGEVREVDYRTYLSEQFLDEAEADAHAEEADTTVDDGGYDEGDTTIGGCEDGLDEYKDLFYRRGESSAARVLNHSVSVPYLGTSSPSGTSGRVYQAAGHSHGHSASVSVGALGSGSPRRDRDVYGERERRKFYTNEEGSGSRVYVGPPGADASASASVAALTLNSARSVSGSSRHRYNASRDSGTNSSRSSFVLGPALSRAASVQRMSSGVGVHHAHSRSQASLGLSSSGRSRAGSVVAVDVLGAAEPIVPLPSPAIEAVSASVRESVATGPPPRRPAPAPLLGIGGVGGEGGERGVVEGEEEIGYFPRQVDTDVDNPASTVRGRKSMGGGGVEEGREEEQLMSSRWSIASSSRESLEVKEKERRWMKRESKEKEKDEKAGKERAKAKSAPSSPSTHAKDKRKSVVGEGGEPLPVTGGKRNRLVSFINRLAGKDKEKQGGSGKESRRNSDSDETGDVKHVRGTWEIIPPVPTNPPPMPPVPSRLNTKMSLVSLRSGRAGMGMEGDVPPTPTTMISDWDVPPPTPTSPFGPGSELGSPRSSRGVLVPNLNVNTALNANAVGTTNATGMESRQGSISPVASRARSHSYMSGYGGQGQPMHVSPPPSPSHVQASFGSVSVLSLGGSVVGAYGSVSGNGGLSPPPTPGFYVAGAGFPKSVTSSPRSSFVYPSVHVPFEPQQQPGSTVHTTSPLVQTTTHLAAPPMNVNLKYGSPESRNTLSSLPSTLDYSASASSQSHGYGLPHTPSSVGEFMDAHLGARGRDGRGRNVRASAASSDVGLAYDDPEGDVGDSESLLMEEAKDIIEAHSYPYESGAVAVGSRRESASGSQSRSRSRIRESGVIGDDEYFDVMDVYGGSAHGHGKRGTSVSSSSAHSRAQSHSGSGSLVVLKEKEEASSDYGSQQQRKAGHGLNGLARSRASASTPDVSASGLRKSEEAPPPVPPKDGVYDVLTGLASQRQKLGLGGVQQQQPSSGYSTSTSSPVASASNTPSLSHVRFPGAQQQQQFRQQENQTGRATPSVVSKGVGGLITRLRLKSSPSLGSLKTSYAQAFVAAQGYMPIVDSPMVKSPATSSPSTTGTGFPFPPPLNRAVNSTGSSAASMSSGSEPSLKSKASTKNFGSLSLAKMMGKARGEKERPGVEKVFREEEEDILELEEEVKSLDPAFGGVGGVGGMIGVGKRNVKGKKEKHLSKDEIELEEELRRMDPTMMVGGGMIGVGR